MLRSLKSMLGYELKAEDGSIGSVNDFLFDDVTWHIRYLQAETGGWLPGKKVIISPGALGKPDWEYRLVPVNLPRDKVRKSPAASFDDPLNRPNEEAICKYYGWPDYWCKSAAKLRALKQVNGFNIRARDGMVGGIDDLIIDDATWDIRYIVADLGGVFLSKKVLLSPRWVDEIVDEGRELRLDAMKDKVVSSPKYDPKEPINKEFEEIVFDYMGKPRYWRQLSELDKKDGADTAKIPEKNSMTLPVASLLILLLMISGYSFVYTGTQTPTGAAVQETTTTIWMVTEKGTTSTLMPTPPTLVTTSTSLKITATTAPEMSSNALGNGTSPLQIRNDPYFGNILVDGKGMTLYYKRTDQPMETDCYGPCATLWPPLMLTAELEISPSIGGKVSGFQRGGGGGRQVTYNGQPIFYYSADKQPGDAKGQGFAGKWYVVRIRQSAAASSQPAQNSTPTPPVVNTARTACQSDYDCVRVKSDCCGCESGGEVIAINRAYDGPWNTELSRRCGTAYCPQTTSINPSCYAKPVCDSGSCTLQMYSQQAVENTSKCTVNSDCGITSDGSICYQGAVYKMTYKPICLRPEGACVLRQILADSAATDCSRYGQTCRNGRCIFEDY